MRVPVKEGHLIELAAIVVFAASAAIIWPSSGWLKAFLCAFSLASIAYSAAAIFILQKADAKDLPALAARHDQRAAFVLAIGLIIVFAALGLVILILTAAHVDAIAVGLAAVSIFAAWALLNMLFAIHYAHVYFSSGSRGETQLEFPGERTRVFSDFVYFSFVIGMTFQVSDVAVLDGGLRRLVLAHSIISFLFNVFVVALAVNAFGGII